VGEEDYREDWEGDMEEGGEGDAEEGGEGAGAAAVAAAEPPKWGVR